MEKKKLLIVTSKWPGEADSSDGGNTTVRELIDLLHEAYYIDILYFGKKAVSERRNGVNHVIHCEIDFDHYESYSKADESKFSMRVKQTDISADIIKRNQESYDRIIIIHIMFLLGIDLLNKSLLEKIILFPMFTGEAYRKCGEKVPDEYILKERIMLNAVKLIVSPSKSEKNMLIEAYGVSAHKIHVIHRCVDQFQYKEHILSGENLKLIYIASVRKQKSHSEAIALLKLLNDSGINASLVCVGAIQDRDIYENCIKLINEFELNGKITFSGNIVQDLVNDYLSISDINISVSKWETFGRGIFEGLAAGVPTIALSRIESLVGYVPPEVMPILCGDIFGIAECISKLMYDTNLYLTESQKGRNLRNFLSTEHARNKLFKSLK